MIKNSLVKYSALALLLMSSVAQAAPASPSQDYITGYVGYFDVIRNDYNATQFGLEYRGKRIQYNIRPLIGINATTDSSVYGYVGLNYDAELIPNQLYLTPNFAVGAYKQGDGKDLGGTIEFRSGIELEYQFPNSHRLGVAFNHISNASIYDHNPGSEAVLVTYSLPMSAFR